MKVDKIHHKTEAVISDDRHEDQQKQSDAIASPAKGVRNSNHAAANNGIYIIK